MELTNGNQILPNGTQLAGWLQQAFDDLKCEVEDVLDVERQSYFLLVNKQKKMTPLEFFNEYPQVSAWLWSLKAAEDDPTVVHDELAKKERQKQAAADTARALAAARAPTQESAEPLVFPYNGQIAPAGVDLAERINVVVRSGVLDSLPTPPALARYLFITSDTIRHSPNRFFAENRADAEALREVVPLLEAEIARGQVIEGLKQVKESLEGMVTTDADGRAVLREQLQKPAAIDWDAILKDPETFAAAFRRR